MQHKFKFLINFNIIHIIFIHFKNITRDSLNHFKITPIYISFKNNSVPLRSNCKIRESKFNFNLFNLKRCKYIVSKSTNYFYVIIQKIMKVKKKIGLMVTNIFLRMRLFTPKVKRNLATGENI